MTKRWTGVLIVCGGLAASVSARPSVSVFEDTNNTVPGVVANTIQADGDGADWTGVVLLVELTAGSVYNDPSFDRQLPQDGFWGFIPELEFDTWLGPPGGTAGDMGGAGDFDAPQSFGSIGLTGAGQQLISATMWNTQTTDTGVSRIGNISLTDDAAGTFTLGVAFAGDYMQRYITNTIVDGRMNFQPNDGDLNLDGFVGINDLNTLLGAWNQTVPPGDPVADPSGDGFVGIDDLGLVLVNWNAGTPPPNHNPVDMPLEGDLNSDGFVGLNDYKIPQHAWNQAVPPGDPLADPTGDRFVGMDDLNLVLSNWNAGTPPGADFTVPEPGAMLLIGAGVLGLFRRSRFTGDTNQRR